MLLILVSIVGFFALYGLALLTALQARRFSSAQAPRPSTTPLSPGESRRLISIVLLTPGGIVLLVWYFVGLTQYEIGTISLTAHGVQTFFSQLDQTQVR